MEHPGTPISRGENGILDSMVLGGDGSGEDDLTGHETRLATGDVSLRDVMPEDLARFFEYRLDPEANRMAAFPARDNRTFTAHRPRILSDETIIKKTVLFDGQVAGNVVSFEQDGKREVGYSIGGRYWGKGVANAVLSAFLALWSRVPSTPTLPDTTAPPSRS